MKISQKKIKSQRSKVWHLYHVPGKGNYTTRPKNAIFINPHNSIEHEIEKVRQGMTLREKNMQFITEAVENKTGLRRDMVVLDTHEIIEIETDPKRAKRFNSDPMAKKIKVIKLWAQTNKK